MIKPRLKTVFVVTISALTVAGCAGAAKNEFADTVNGKEASTNISFAKGAGYSDLYLDSVMVEQFIEEHGVDRIKAENIRDFYKSRSYQFAWFAQDGLDEHGRAFWNLHNNYVNYAQDSSFFNRQLHRRMEVLLNEEEAGFNENDVRELELSLTEHFFDYAQYAFAGKINPESLKWHIPRKKINAVALLDSLIARNGNNLNEWEPVNQQYKLMRNELIRYYKLEKAGGWEEIKGDQKVCKQDDSSTMVTLLKERLRSTGDYKNEDASPLFTHELKTAVLKAQKRYGLAADGIVGPATLRALNIPVSERIKQMLVNMERMRWMPASGEGIRLVANIPEYKLHVYEGGEKVFDMRIVVGKAAHKTVVFNDELKHIVFSPYWNIPASIIRNEILPSINRNPAYLAQNNMEQTGTRNGLPVFRQKPGSSNSLGRVKFLFPNSYAIYFHDTPAKSLFDRNRRAFSHGCIRLSEPKRLAVYLLKDKAGWDDSRITNAMYAESEEWVNLAEPVPVAITYFTAWVDDKGLVNFRDDIYGHDKALAEKLFDGR